MASLDERLREARGHLDHVDASPPDPASIGRLRRRRQLRSAGALLAIVALGSAVAMRLPGGDEDSTTLLADEGRVRRAPILDALGWDGARTDNDGRTLVIAGVGAAEYQPGAPCTADYRGTADETKREVRVRITHAPQPRRAAADTADEPEVFACNAAGSFRIVRIELQEPLGDRRVIYGKFDRERHVFDGSLLLHPVLPEGWSIRLEGPGYPGPQGRQNDWSRTWMPSSPAGDGCSASNEPVTLIQGPTDVVEQYTSTQYAAPPTRYEVRGHQAAFFMGSGAYPSRLAWTEGERGFVLSGDLWCAKTGTTPPEVLLRFAESLR